MATEAAREGYYGSPCCADGGCFSRAASPDPRGFYNGPEEKCARDSQSGSAQYASWSTPAGYAYPSNNAKSFAPPPYCVPHGVPPMTLPVPPLPFGAAGNMVVPQPPMFGIPAARSPTRGRADTDTSSSNCTPRDHYTDKSTKRHGRKTGTPGFPVVKIPETLKKQGQPSPALWHNSRGFPIRMGKPDCKHYATKGWCAYGTLCKFNHPENMHAPGMPYPMMPYAPPGSQPMMVSSPWMGVPYQWSGAWSQGHQSPPSVHGYPHYVCQPHSAGPCSTESGSHEEATDTESNPVYN